MKTPEENIETEEEKQQRISISELISGHYDDRRKEYSGERSSSRVIFLRGFNNWVKITLLSETCARLSRGPIRVIDLACGRGGDVNKWKRTGAAHVAFVDFSKQSIEECQRRYSSMSSLIQNKSMYTADFYELNMVNDDLYHNIFGTDGPVSNDRLFKIVACQFAIHYAFGSYNDVVKLLSNVSKCLRSGGYFIGTTTDCFELVRRLKDFDGEIGNSVYRIKLDVYFPAFERIAADFGLKLVMRSNFSDFFKNFHKSNERTLRRMNALEPYPLVPCDDLVGGDPVGNQYAHAKRFVDRPHSRQHTDAIGTMSVDEWEVATLYTCFMFKRV
ncbi:hypothetical protein ACOME3_005881 [Neoechinorhynchus agilis]